MQSALHTQTCVMWAPALGSRGPGAQTPACAYPPWHTRVHTHLSTDAHAQAHTPHASSRPVHEHLCHVSTAVGSPTWNPGSSGEQGVNRCREMPPGSTGSLVPRMTPPHSPALLQAQPARTRRPSAQCPGLLGCRQIPRRCLVHPDSAAATAPALPAPFPVPSAAQRCPARPSPPAGQRHQPLAPHPPGVERRLLSGITMRGLPSPPT